MLGYILAGGALIWMLLVKKEKLIQDALNEVKNAGIDLSKSYDQQPKDVKLYIESMLSQHGATTKRPRTDETRAFYELLQNKDSFANMQMSM